MRHEHLLAEEPETEQRKASSLPVHRQQAYCFVSHLSPETVHVCHTIENEVLFFNMQQVS